MLEGKTVRAYSETDRAYSRRGIIIEYIEDIFEYI